MYLDRKQLFVFESVMVTSVIAYCRCIGANSSMYIDIDCITFMPFIHLNSEGLDLSTAAPLSTLVAFRNAVILIKILHPSLWLVC